MTTLKGDVAIKCPKTGKDATLRKDCLRIGEYPRFTPCEFYLYWHISGSRISVGCRYDDRPDQAATPEKP